MLKPVMQVAAGGIAAFLLWKIAAVLLVPLLGIAAGLLLLVIKVALFALALLLVWLVYRWVSRPSNTTA